MKDAKGHGSDARGAHSEGVNQVGQQKHFDSQGLPLAPGDTVQDKGRAWVGQDGTASPVQGTVTRTYFEGGDPENGKPLMDVKIGGASGTTVTRSGTGVTKVGGADITNADRASNLQNTAFAKNEVANSNKSDMNPYTARMVLQATGSRDKDYHTLNSSQTSDLHDYAKQFGYRKSASSPGSTGRAFHSYLHKQLSK